MTGPRVLVVGSGWRFTSGISYYTCRLANALAERVPTDVLLARRLVPRALYPGRRRVGHVVNDLAYDPRIAVSDSLDWFWGPGMVRSLRFLARRQPDVLVLQWWTGALLHTYLLLALVARRRGATVVLEWHEVQDTGEARLPLVERYVRAAIGLLLARVDGHVVHSEHDLDLLRASYDLDPERTSVAVVPHGPYDHVVDPAAEAPAPDGPTTFLFFGIIRPYKGLEDLVEAFGRVAGDRDWRLRIVGETWEGWTAPLDAVAASPVRDRIDVVNRYVTDEEARTHFAQAHAVVLPYHRSSSSGPLHMAMSAGLPVAVTAVGGLVDAARDYDGALLVPARDPQALADALVELADRRGMRYDDPHSWRRTTDAYLDLVDGLTSAPGSVLESTTSTTDVPVRSAR